MIPLASLWLPIVLSAVIVFVASSVLHMVLTYHQSDYSQIPEEDKLLAALRPANLKPGLYVFPFFHHKEMNSPAAIEKYKQGPVGFMTIMRNGTPNMPKILILWFIYCLIIGVFVAYLTKHAVPSGSAYLVVFRAAAVAALLAYGVAQLSNAIWRGQTWSAAIKELIDGLIYALLTAGTFGWLWPR